MRAVLFYLPQERQVTNLVNFSRSFKLVDCIKSLAIDVHLLLGNTE